eukprot:180934-Rhodomonas_salina.2
MLLSGARAHLHLLSALLANGAEFYLPTNLLRSARTDVAHPVYSPKHLRGDAMAGTDVAYGATRTRLGLAGSCPYLPTRLLCGVRTDTGYAATRRCAVCGVLLTPGMLLRGGVRCATDTGYAATSVLLTSGMLLRGAAISSTTSKTVLRLKVSAYVLAMRSPVPT